MNEDSTVVALPQTHNLSQQQIPNTNTHNANAFIPVIIEYSIAA